MRNLLLILGNGFSIDFVQHIGKIDVIDVKNLFRLGHTVRFPDAANALGFLSHKHCPNLWLLGARPNKDDKECMAIIEEIITCSNMLFDYRHHVGSDKERLKLLEPDNQSVYIKAYIELSFYLRHLFISYNNKITDVELTDFVNTTNWGWISFLKNAQKEYSRINIVSYNYDIWLERILDALNIEYHICGCDTEDKAFSISKPHGSISFVPNTGLKEIYQINYAIDAGDAEIDCLKVSYNDLEKYNKSFLIPPAGDSLRHQSNVWSKTLRECAIDSVKGISDIDDAIICGMSYWHVDRKELDELLINLSQSVNIILMNPSPPKDLNAVLVTLFNNYTVFTSSDSLKEAL